MRIADRSLRLLALLAVAGLSSVARAGGPLIVDPVSGKAFTYPQGSVVPVYHDLGDLAVVIDWANYPNTVTFPNAVGAGLVRTGMKEWSSVPTSSFRAEVKGDFSALGLPDITAANANLVIGAWNGGGDHVIFDADGSVMAEFFGVGDGVLGISTPEFGDSETGTILESWTVLNGQAISADDADAAHFQGVTTHELGHAIGLAHTQTNGAAYFYGPFIGEPLGPQSCSTLPYRTDLGARDVETMYPFTDPSPYSDIGLGMGHVHTTDDRAIISDLYPRRDWLRAYGTISGTVLDIDGKTPLTGVNVVARNVDDPFVDASSSITGEWTQGQFGPDGSFVLHGLRPGARYVVYVDALVAGGYSTPALWFLPGAERFYAGRGGHGHDRDDDVARRFDPCQYQIIRPRAGSAFTADIEFERVRGAPVLISFGYGTGGNGISGDGQTVVGNFGRGGPPFRWTEKTGLVPMDVATTGEVTTISRNGRYITTNLLNAWDDTALGAFRWDERNGWLPVDPVGSCGTDTTATYGVANDGTVYGLAYNSCTDFKTFAWSPRSGTKLLPNATFLPDGTPANGRPNQISADGSVLVGWEEVDWGGRIAVVWVNGKPREILDENGQQVEEATAVSGDGEIVGGARFQDGLANSGFGWRKRLGRQGLDYFAPVVEGDAPIRPYALSRDGRVMAGFSGDPFFSFTPGPFLWTRELGAVDLNQFLKRQGTAFEQFASLWTPMAMSDDGSVITGWGIGTQFFAGWVLQMPKVFICHLERGERGEGHTRNVKFPEEFDRHIAHGDTDGPCPHHRE
jgi:hypothetical protein